MAKEEEPITAWGSHPVFLQYNNRAVQLSGTTLAQALVAKEKEPITPFIAKIRALKAVY